jgi:hypothetical protein
MRTGICTTDLCPRTAEKLFKKLKELETPVTQFNFGSVTEAGFIPDGQIDIPDTLDISVLRKIKDCSAEYAIEVAVQKTLPSGGLLGLQIDKSLLRYKEYKVFVGGSPR